MDKYFLVQVKRTNGTIEKGVVVKDTLNDAKQSYHAYLGAYGYGRDVNTDYVMVGIMNGAGTLLYSEVDDRIPVPYVVEEEEPAEPASEEA